MNDVLVKYTYYGDANLDGKVDGSDYSRIDSPIWLTAHSNSPAGTTAISTTTASSTAATTR